MAENGLVVVPRLGDPQVTEVGVSASGAKVFSTKVHLHLTIVNVDDPHDTVVAEWWGEARDTGDKGIQKAGSSAAKFALMKLLQLGGAEDTEADVPREVAAPLHVPGAMPFDPASGAAPVRSDLPGMCVDCALMGFTTTKGQAPRYWPSKYGPQCNGVDRDGKYMNHRPKAHHPEQPLPEHRGVTHDADHVYLEGDACPLPHDAGRPAKFVIAKGGPLRGLLQCNGKVNGEWANHAAPLPVHQETGEEIPF